MKSGSVNYFNSGQYTFVIDLNQGVNLIFTTELDDNIRCQLTASSKAINDHIEADKIVFLFEYCGILQIYSKLLI